MDAKSPTAYDNFFISPSFTKGSSYQLYSPLPDGTSSGQYPMFTSAQSSARSSGSQSVSSPHGDSARSTRDPVVLHQTSVAASTEAIESRDVSVAAGDLSSEVTRTDDILRRSRVMMANFKLQREAAFRKQEEVTRNVMEATKIQYQPTPSPLYSLNPSDVSENSQHQHISSLAVSQPHLETPSLPMNCAHSHCCCDGTRRSSHCESVCSDIPRSSHMDDTVRVHARPYSATGRLSEHHQTHFVKSQRKATKKSPPSVEKFKEPGRRTDANDMTVDADALMRILTNPQSKRERQLLQEISRLNNVSASLREEDTATTPQRPAFNDVSSRTRAHETSKRNALEHHKDDMFDDTGDYSSASESFSLNPSLQFKEDPEIESLRLWDKGDKRFINPDDGDETVVSSLPNTDRTSTSLWSQESARDLDTQRSDEEQPPTPKTPRPGGWDPVEANNERQRHTSGPPSQLDPSKRSSSGFQESQRRSASVLSADSLLSSSSSNMTVATVVNIRTESQRLNKVDGGTLENRTSSHRSLNESQRDGISADEGDLEMNSMQVAFELSIREKEVDKLIAQQKDVLAMFEERIKVLMEKVSHENVKLEELNYQKRELREERRKIYNELSHQPLSDSERTNELSLPGISSPYLSDEDLLPPHSDIDEYPGHTDRTECLLDPRLGQYVDDVPVMDDVDADTDRPNTARPEGDGTDEANIQFGDQTVRSIIERVIGCERSKEVNVVELDQLMKEFVEEVKMNECLQRELKQDGPQSPPAPEHPEGQHTTKKADEVVEITSRSQTSEPQEVVSDVLSNHALPLAKKSASAVPRGAAIAEHVDRSGDVGGLQGRRRKNTESDEAASSKRSSGLGSSLSHVRTNSSQRSNSVEDIQQKSSTPIQMERRPQRDDAADKKCRHSDTRGRSNGRRDGQRTGRSDTASDTSTLLSKVASESSLVVEESGRRSSQISNRSGSRNRRRRVDAVTSAALRHYLHASSSSDLTDLEGEKGGPSPRDQPQLRQRSRSVTELGRSKACGTEETRHAKKKRSQPSSTPLIVPQHPNKRGTSAPKIFPGEITAHPGHAIRSIQLYAGFVFSAGEEEAVVRQFNLQTHQSVRMYCCDTQTVTAFHVSKSATSEGRLYVAGCDGLVIVFSLKDGVVKCRTSLDFPALVMAIGTSLLYLGLSNGRVAALDLTTNQISPSFCPGEGSECGDRVRTLAVSGNPSDAFFLLAGGTRGVTVLEATTGRYLRRLVVHGQTPVGLDVMSGDALLQWTLEAVRIVGLKSGQMISEICLPVLITSVCVVSDTLICVGCVNGAVHMYHMENNSPSGDVTQVVYAPKRIAITSLICVDDMLVTGNKEGDICIVHIEKSTFNCKFGSCTSAFPTRDDVIYHVMRDHVLAATDDEVKCDWQGCEHYFNQLGGIKTIQEHIEQHA